MITAKTCLFAIGMLGAYGMWLSVSRMKAPRIKVIVYHMEGDAYFESFQVGIVEACHQFGMQLDYVNFTNLDDPFIDAHISDQIASDTFDLIICRVPSDEVLKVLQSTGKPFASIMSDTLIPNNVKGFVARVGLEDITVHDHELLVVDSTRIQTRTAPRPSVLITSPRDVLHDLVALKGSYTTIAFLGHTLLSQELRSYLPMLPYKNVRLTDFDGKKHGRFLVSVLHRSAYKDSNPQG